MRITGITAQDPNDPIDDERGPRDQHARPDESANALRRVLGPGMLVFLVVGDILGAGIYSRVGAVSAEVGGAIWVSFLVAMVVAALTACSYAELVTKYPGAGGAALYVHRAWKLPPLTFIIAFSVMVSGISSAASAARAFGGDYLHVFIDIPVFPVAVVFLLAIAVINFRGIAESARINLALTCAELGGLLLIVLIGGLVLSDGSGNPARAFELKPNVNVPLAILSGAVIAFYSFLGFEDTVNLAEETRNPSRVFPRGLLGGLALAGLVYVLVSMTAAMVVEPETLASSSGPLLEVVRRGPLSVPGWLFSAIALMAISNTALLNMVMASRLLYGMAREGIVPRILGVAHVKRQTPWVAIVFTTLLGFGLVLTGDLGDLANTTVFLLLFVFALVNAAVPVLRRDPVSHEHFQVPMPLPVIGALTCLPLLALSQRETVMRAMVLLAVGAALWLVSRVVDRPGAAP
jgi:APA family basic amino acid/polyamine antiporter